jgi:L-lactate dehydrogenase complex protein LldE
VSGFNDQPDGTATAPGELLPAVRVGNVTTVDQGDQNKKTTAAVQGKRRPRVALLVTCLVDLMRPSVGFAAVKLLEDAGCEVIVPSQTCCGQPAYNSGDKATAQALALQIMDGFSGADYVVAPSGSCAGMAARHYPELFAHDPNLAVRAQAFADKTHELVSFLTDIMGVTSVEATFERTVTYHDSCAGLREMHIKQQPRSLLGSVAGLTLVEMKDAEVCCGFGGTFATKYGEISDAIVGEKTRNIDSSKAEVLLAGDLGCLMNMAGKLTRQGRKTEVRHIAEVLANMTDAPAIAAPEDGST